MDGIMVKERRGAGKGDGGVRGILDKFHGHTGLIAVKLDVVYGGTSLKVFSGRGEEIAHAADFVVTCEVNGSDEDILLVGASQEAGAYELVKLGGRPIGGLFDWLGLVSLDAQEHSGY